jgi:hypothetical protein
VTERRRTTYGMADDPARTPERPVTWDPFVRAEELAREY